MKNRFLTYGVVAAALLGVLSLLLISSPAAQNAAQGTNAAAGKPTPRMSNGKPDFSGFYNNTGRYRGDFGDEEGGQHVIDRRPDGSIFFDYGGANIGPGLVATGESNNQPSYRPEWKSKVDALAATMYGGNTNLDPQLECKPGGVPRAGMGEYLIQTPQALVMLYEAAPGPFYRIIYTDGREHPKDFDTSYFGHSVGHWEGDTLVVDTVGLNDETWLGGGQTGANKHTNLHSDKLHVVERISRKGDEVSWEAVVEDPIALTKPWVPGKRTQSISAPDDYIQPQMCVGLDKGHFILHNVNPKDTNLRCGWCNPESVYGGSSDAITSPILAEQEKARKEGRATGRGGAGGE